MATVVFYPGSAGVGVGGVLGILGIAASSWVFLFELILFTHHTHASKLIRR